MIANVFRGQAVPWHWLSASLCLAAGALASGAETARAGVEVRTYSDWADSLWLESPDEDIRAVVVPAIGGRIVHYSLNGQNIIYEIPESEGKTLSNTTGRFSVGGYQCDLGPELRGIPDHPLLWMGPYQWKRPRDQTVTVTSPPDPALGVQLEKEIVIDIDTGELGITQRMKNVSSQPVAFCLWDRTLCQGGGYAFFKLNKKSRLRAGWALRRTVDGHDKYDPDHPASPHVRVMDGYLVAETIGEPTKVGADSDGGWIAYAKGRTLFVKYYAYFPKSNYSDGGHSVELYFDQRVAELEPLSPEITLKPGAAYTFPEKWALMELEMEVKTFEQARSLVKRIPKFKF